MNVAGNMVDSRNQHKHAVDSCQAGALDSTPMVRHPDRDLSRRIIYGGIMAVSVVVTSPLSVHKHAFARGL